MFHASISRFLIAAIITTAIANAKDLQHPRTCKSAPTSDCWPSAADWSALNRTIDGHLIHAVPPASVCYPSQSNYDETECAYIRSQWFNSSFHAEDPISIDYPIWADNSCNPVYPNGSSVTGDAKAGDKGCSIGNYPVYVVNATKAEHIAETFKWAGKKAVRVVVKNTGHSYPGRSIGYGSLSIWTHNFRGVTYDEDFQPKSCRLNVTQKATRIAAGETGASIMAEMFKHDAIVVIGANPSVGIVGWFTGGGHGFLSSTYGMGADNLLEATIVTPTGTILTTNACQYPDLFFAIRGGGGGTYGVITSAVMKAYPAPSTTVHSLRLTATSTTITTDFWNLMAFLHSELPALKDGGMQGYYFIVGPPYIPTLSFLWTFYMYDKPNGTAEELFGPIKEYLDTHADLFTYQATTTPSQSFFSLFAASSNEQVATGGSAYGSRLLPHRALTEDVDALARTFEAIGPSVNLTKFSGAVSNTIMLGHMVANSANSDLEIGLNPAWRDAVVHLIVTEGWLDGMPASLIASVYRDITENKTQALRQLAPDSGAYFNECDSYEPDWQYAFFGPNYPRLLEVKQKYDPEGVLWCRRCVGSEAWVEQVDGKLCRPEAVEWEENSGQTPL